MNIETLSAEQRAELQAQLDQSNTVSGWEKDEANFEKRFKDTQASYTKANEEKINLAKELARINPKAILNMDAKTQAKVIKDEFGYDDLDTLKIMKPDVFEDKPDGDDADDDDNTKLRREVELLKMQSNKSAVEWAISDFITSHKEVTSAIPDFEKKINDELKYISSELPAKERVSRATKLISSNNDINIEAFLALQGKNHVKSPKGTMSDDNVLKAQNQLRAQLWLKTK